MSRVKTKAVQIDTDELKGLLKNIDEQVRFEVAALAAASLQAQIDAINAAATMRRQALEEANIKIKSSGTTDEPLKGAEVVISTRASSKGTREGRMIVYVKHRDANDKNLFNILDAGAKNRRAKGTFVFPTYEGNMIPIGASGDPEEIQANIKRGNVRLKRNKEGKPALSAKKKGQVIQGFRGKGLYQAAREYAERELIGLPIKYGKRILRLKKGDVQVSVPDRPRFEE